METAQEIIQQIATLHYFGLFGISLLANIIVPIPEEIIILAIGYSVGSGHFLFLPTLGIVIAGTFIIDVLMFWLARINNRLVIFFYKKVFSKIFPIEHDFLIQHAEKIIFFSRFLVQLRFLGPFIAGQVKVTWKKFITYDLAAVIVYVSGLLVMGNYFAKSLERIFDGIHIVRNGIVIVLFLVILWSLGKIIRSKFLEYLR